VELIVALKKREISFACFYLLALAVGGRTGP